MSNLQDQFEYKNEQEKIRFQSYLHSLLEAHADFLHKISHAKGNNKNGIWFEMSEAEIISGHILECCTNLMVPFQNVADANRLLNVNLKATQRLVNSNIRKSIEDFKADRITKDQFAQQVNEFVGLPKMKIA